MKNNISRARKNNYPFFVIVHATLLDKSDIKRNPGQFKEIKRIKREEDFAEVRDRPQKIPSGVPRSRKILVCGAMGNCCVAIQNGALKRAGYNAEIYKKATIYE